MTDSEWKRLIVRTIAAQRKVYTLRLQAESEYQRRFGALPSDVDDDWWIDTIEGRGENAPCLKSIIGHARESCA